MAAELKAGRAGPKGEVLVLEFGNAPANALSADLRGALLAALQTDAQAVVIAASGRHFSSATTIDLSPEDAAAVPTLATLCAALDASPRPVIVALQGAVTGPGAELALAAHARIASADLRFSLNDVGFGLCPQAGSTQRLPRITGTAEALSLLLTGRAVLAEEAVAAGLVDHLTEGDLRAAAVEAALFLRAPRPTPARTDVLRDMATHAEAVAQARAEARRGTLPAPSRIIDCVDAALFLPLENGLALEAVSREDLADTPESRGLIAAARAERRASTLPAMAQKAQSRLVSQLGLVGTAPSQAALALMALGQVMSVFWTETDPARLAQAVKWVADRQEAEVRAGRMTPVQRDADLARLHAVPGLPGLSQAGLVVHSSQDAAHATLSRSMPVAPQLVLGGAEGVLGLTLAPSVRVAELAVPEGVKAEHIAIAVATLRRLGVPPVLTGKMPFVGRRVTAAGRAALVRLLEMGVPRRVIAAALDGFGQPLPDLPEVTPASLHPITEDEVVKRWLGAQANEAFRLLDARIARRPSDVDHLLVQGHGFPRWRGGPMHHVAERGLLVLRVDLRKWAADDPLWAPHPLLERLVSQGRRLSELDGA